MVDRNRVTIKFLTKTITTMETEKEEIKEAFKKSKIGCLFWAIILLVILLFSIN